MSQSYWREACELQCLQPGSVEEYPRASARFNVVISVEALSRNLEASTLGPGSDSSSPKVERLRGEGALEAFEDKAGV